MQVAQHIITHRKNSGIKEAADLSGKIIDVRKGTAYQQRLVELKNQGIDLAIRLHNDLPVEELIQKVADGQIDFTSCQQQHYFNQPSQLSGSGQHRIDQ